MLFRSFLLNFFIIILNYLYLQYAPSLSLCVPFFSDSFLSLYTHLSTTLHRPIHEPSSTTLLPIQPLRSFSRPIELYWRASSQTQTPVGVRAPLSSSASGSGGSWISSELEAAEMKKQILQKTLEQIHSSSSSFILFSLQWKDLEDQFEGI